MAWPDDAVFVSVDGGLHAVAQAESGETGHPLGFVNPAIGWAAPTLSTVTGDTRPG